MGPLVLLQALLLLMLSGSVDAFVYSCEEVKFKLMNSNMEHNTTYACVSTQEGFSNTNQLSSIYFNGKWSLWSVDPNCYSRGLYDEPWKITAVSGLNLNCDQEFTVVFQSDTSNYGRLKKAQDIYTLQGSSYQSTSTIWTSPRTKMYFHTYTCYGGGSVTMWTGAGNGENEERFFLRSWPCSVMPKMVYAFDNVITITVDPEVTYTAYASTNMGGSGDPPISQVSYGDYLFVYSSGLSDDLQNRDGFTNNRAYINIGTKTDVTVNMQINLDWRDKGSVRIQKKRGDKTVYNYYYSQNEKFNTDYFEVRFEPSPFQPQEIGNSEDHILIDVYIGVDPPPPTTPRASTTMPTTMTTTTTTTTAAPTTTTMQIPLTVQPPMPTGKGYCGCDVDKFGFPIGWEYNNIWLDIVVILDTSEAMGADALDDASALIESFIADADDNIDFLITNSTAPFYTRVGVIAMSDIAEILYNLNMTRDDKVQGKVSIKTGVIQIDVVEAFDAALKMFNNGINSKPDRVSTRQVIYYMTDSNPGSNLNQLNQFKSTQGVIIVNNFIEEEDVQLPALKKLASDGYYFSDSNFMVALQAFCKANCFCKPDKFAYGGADPAIEASGGCYHASPSGVPFSKAKSSCSDEKGIITSIHDDAKGQFVQQLMANTGTKSDYFWIGYEKSDDGVWRWEDQSADPYTNWDKDEPLANSVANCAYVDTTQWDLPWGAGTCMVGFPFVCECAPCSVGYKNC